MLLYNSHGELTNNSKYEVIKKLLETQLKIW